MSGWKWSCKVLSGHNRDGQEGCRGKRRTYPLVFAGAYLPGKHNSLALWDIVEKDESTSFSTVWDISKTNPSVGQGGCLQEAKWNQEKQQERKMGCGHWGRAVIVTLKLSSNSWIMFASHLYHNNLRECYISLIFALVTMTLYIKRTALLQWDWMRKE